MSEHRHLVDGQPSRALALGWCRCGEELQLKYDPPRWREPRTAEGKRLRHQWVPEEDE